MSRYEQREERVTKSDCLEGYFSCGVSREVATHPAVLLDTMVMCPFWRVAERNSCKEKGLKSEILYLRVFYENVPQWHRRETAIAFN